VFEQILMQSYKINMNNELPIVKYLLSLQQILKKETF